MIDAERNEFVLLNKSDKDYDRQVQRVMASWHRVTGKNPQTVPDFQVGEEITVRGYPFRVGQVQRRALILRPVRLRRRKKGGA